MVWEAKVLLVFIGLRNLHLESQVVGVYSFLFGVLAFIIIHQLTHQEVLLLLVDLNDPINVVCLRRRVLQGDGVGLVLSHRGLSEPTAALLFALLVYIGLLGDRFHKREVLDAACGIRFYVINRLFYLVAFSLTLRHLLLAVDDVGT